MPKMQRDRNTWGAKWKRTLTSVLPVDPARKGACQSCGACCSLPNRCPFLRFDEHGKSRCAAYAWRPLNCRKYPRTWKEHVTWEHCGFSFDPPV